MEGSGSGSGSIEMGYDDIYGPYDPIFAMDDFDLDVHQNRLLTSMIVNPDPSNEYYAALLANEGRLKNEKARFEKINEEKARFDSQRNLYLTWMEKKWKHRQVSHEPFTLPQPKVGKDVLEYFEKLTQDKAVLRFETNVDVPPLEIPPKVAPLPSRWTPAEFQADKARRHEHEMASREDRPLTSETESSVNGDADVADDSSNV